MNFKLATAAAILSTAMAAPALAQDPAPRAPSARHQQDQARMYRQQDQARIYHRDSGFWPGDVAAGVVGGAIGTAGAIATAPFRNDTYAYYDNRSYAERNGFVCQPGTRFRGADGRLHICQ